MTVHYAFPKNAREEVRASLDEYHGRSVAALRVFVPTAGGAMVPTQKGLTVATESLPALKAAVDALCAAALIPPITGALALDPTT